VEGKYNVASGINTVPHSRSGIKHRDGSRIEQLVRCPTQHQQLVGANRDQGATWLVGVACKKAQSAACKSVTHKHCPPTPRICSHTSRTMDQESWRLRDSGVCGLVVHNLATLALVFRGNFNTHGRRQRTERRRVSDDGQTHGKPVETGCAKLC